MTRVYGDKHEPEAGEDLGGDGPRCPLENLQITINGGSSSDDEHLGASSKQQPSRAGQGAPVKL